MTKHRQKWEQTFKYRRSFQMLERVLSKRSEQGISSETIEPIEPIEPISKEEIQRSIGAIKNHKIPGSDTISAEVFKTSGEEMNNFFKKKFNKGC